MVLAYSFAVLAPREPMRIHGFVPIWIVRATFHSSRNIGERNKTEFPLFLILCCKNSFWSNFCIEQGFPHYFEEFFWSLKIEIKFVELQILHIFYSEPLYSSEFL